MSLFYDVVSSLSPYLSIGGPIGRTVTDVAKVFSAIAGGYDPRDPSTTDPARPAALSAPKDYTTFLDAGALRGAKIAVNDESVYQTGADQKYIDIFYDTLNKLQAAGATIVYNFTIPGA